MRNLISFLDCCKNLVGKILLSACGMDPLKQRPRFSSLLPFACGSRRLPSTGCSEPARGTQSPTWETLHSLEHRAAEGRLTSCSPTGGPLMPPPRARAGWSPGRRSSPSADFWYRWAAQGGFWVFVWNVPLSVEVKRGWESAGSRDVSRTSRVQVLSPTWADYKFLKGRDQIFRSTVASWYKLGHQNSFSCYDLILTFSQPMFHNCAMGIFIVSSLQGCCEIQWVHMCEVLSKNWITLGIIFHLFNPVKVFQWFLNDFKWCKKLKKVQQF